MEHELESVDDLVVVVELEHGSGEGFNINVGFFEFDVAVEICEKFGFHVHATENGNQPEHCELFVCFVGVVIHCKFFLEFAFDGLDSVRKLGDFGVALLDLFLKFTDHEDRVFE